MVKDIEVFSSSQGPWEPIRIQLPRCVGVSGETASAPEVGPCARQLTASFRSLRHQTEVVDRDEDDLGHRWNDSAKPGDRGDTGPAERGAAVATCPVVICINTIGGDIFFFFSYCLKAFIRKIILKHSLSLQFIKLVM